MNWKKLIPTSLRMLISRKYADAMLDDAINKANEEYKRTGHRYFVYPMKDGNLKVTNAEYETRDRKRDKRLLKKSTHSPYKLRREAYYFTPSNVCKSKYQPQGMQDWEVDAMRKIYYRWYFQHH